MLGVALALAGKLAGVTELLLAGVALIARAVPGAEEFTLRGEVRRRRRQLETLAVELERSEAPRSRIARDTLKTLARERAEEGERKP